MAAWASSMRSFGSTLLKLVLAALIFVASAELLVRVVRPRPRSQIVRLAQFAQQNGVQKFARYQGVFLWQTYTSGKRSAPCAPSTQHRVVLLGESILASEYLPAAQASRAQLSEALHRISPGWCVINLAQPAYGGEQKLAEGLRWLEQEPPDVFVLSVWHNDPAKYRQIGTNLYALNGYDLDEDGFPASRLLPVALDHWAFLHSRAYEYMSLALGVRSDVTTPGSTSWDEYIESLKAFYDALQRQNTKLILVLFPPLDRPFVRALQEEMQPGKPYNQIRAWAEGARVPVVNMAQELSEQDQAELRFDLCCHYNARGVERISSVLAPVVAAALEGAQTEASEPVQ